MGESKFMSAFAVWTSKREGLRIEQTPLMKIGLALEPAILDMWEDEHKQKLVRPGKLNFASSGTILGASLDGYTEMDSDATYGTVVDAKNLRKADTLPFHYHLQLAAQMHGANKSHGELACLISGREFKTFHVPRDMELENSILEYCEQWWQKHIAQGEQPPIDGSDSATKWLKEKYARAEKGLVIESTSLIENCVKGVKDCKAQIEGLEIAQKEYENRLKQLIGDAEEVSGVLTWKNNKDTSKTDWEALAKELQATEDLISKFTTTKPGARVLRLK
jgi:predicted phage-related endonuclease